MKQILIEDGQQIVKVAEHKLGINPVDIRLFVQEKQTKRSYLYWGMAASLLLPLFMLIQIQITRTQEPLIHQQITKQINNFESHLNDSLQNEKNAIVADLKRLQRDFNPLSNI